jgi:hypothetical protein
MTRESATENLLDQILALPDEAQAEIVRALIESQGDDSDLYRLDDDNQRAERALEKA